MSVSYKKLWKLLIDKDMKKKDLEKAAGISNYDAVVLMGLFTFLFLGAGTELCVGRKCGGISFVSVV